MNNKVITSSIIEYKNIKRVTGFTCDVIGEDESNYYDMEFRYSTDRLTPKNLNDPNINDDSKCLWSDFYQLTNKNLMKMNIYDSDTLYIQYRFTKNGTGVLSVESISLDVEYVDGTDKIIPDCYWTSDKSIVPSIVYDCGVNGSSNRFNPYDLGRAIDVYNQLSALVSNMFGHCVTYFKTEANSKSRDVVLKEYSLEHVVDKQTVKVLVPDNQMPTRELQFNTMMIDYPVQFEVHIVKSEFRKVFGLNSHPDPHDYIYFQQYMQKMYMVDSVSEPDDYNYTGSYWRVSLVPYQELTSVKFDNEDLQEDTETIIFSAEGKFEKEIEQEFADNRKDSILNDMNDLGEGMDSLRRKLNPNIRIISENIFNNYTAISKQHYDLSTVDKDTIAVEYRYNNGFSSSDERMITLWFRPKNTEANISNNISILNIKDGKDKGGIRLNVQMWDSTFVIGNYVMVSRCGSANGYRKIINLDKSKKLLYVEGEYDEKCVPIGCAKCVGYEVNKLLAISNEDGYLATIDQADSSISLDIAGKQHVYRFDNKNFTGFEDKWYAMVLAMSHGKSNVWLYVLDGSDKKESMNTKISLIGRCSNDIGEFNLGDNCYYDIISGNLNLTNFRLWNKMCEEELHELILSQYVVEDTHNAVIVDNAQNELLVNYKWS